MIFYKCYCADVILVCENKSVVVGSVITKVPLLKSACGAYQSIAEGLCREYGDGHRIVNFRRVR